jgi:hypothetical protein
MAMLNTAFADGMRALNDLLEGKGEGGVRLNLRDACAKLYQVKLMNCLLSVPCVLAATAPCALL